MDAEQLTAVRYNVEYGGVFADQPARSSSGRTSSLRVDVSTVGRDEKLIREYIRNQEKEGKKLDQLLLTK